MARTSSYNEKMADTICERIANGESLNSICKGEDTPAQSTVFKWLSDIPGFSEKYARAREAQADTIFDEILDIADNAANDWMERHNADEENIGWQLNGDHVQRSRLRIDARKWMAGKLRPKKYGDKLDVEHGVTGGVAELLERIAGAGKRLGANAGGD